MKGIATIAFVLLATVADAQHVFVRGKDGGLWGKWRDEIGWTGWRPVAGAIHSSPDTCHENTATGDGTVSVVALDQHGAVLLVQRRGGVWGGWRSLGGQMTSAPAIVCSTRGLEVFARGANRALLHKRVDAEGSQTGWFDLGGEIAGAPDAAAGDEGRMYVVARGTDDAVWLRAFADGRWQDWDPLGGEVTSDPSIVSWWGDTPGARIEIFVRGTGNAIYQGSLVNNAVARWESRGGELRGAPDAANVGSLGSLHPILQVVARGTDDAVWTIEYSQRGWSRWASLGGETTDDPGAAGGLGWLATASGRYRITVRGFSIGRATVDHMLDADGKGDEVALYAHVAEVDASVDLARYVPQVAERRTLIHGDVHNLPGRVQAGSASPLGGLVSFERVPRGARWDAPAEPQTDRFPLLVWEGELRDQANGVVVMPVMWEMDSDPRLMFAWTPRFARWWPVFVQTLPSQIRSGVIHPGPTLASGMDVWRHIPNAFQQDGHRPIGMQRIESGEKFEPVFFLFTFRSAEHTARTDTGHGPGVIAIPFSDAPELAGVYTLFLRVERLQ